ncbi:MAG TPA: bL35 family ribosomal protein [Natronosporangium sp.]
MPKMKSHSGMAKRVRVTSSGKVVRQRAGSQSGASFASQPIRSTRKSRRLAGTVEVSKADTKRVKKLLGR